MGAPFPAVTANPSRFGTTCWSLVLSAGQAHSPESQDAMESLCRLYWYPIYAYVRRRGYQPQEAEDFTQAFFLRILERNTVGEADPQRGRFRSFLLGALKQFLSNELDRSQSLKRGGGCNFISFDAAEQRYGTENRDAQTPERLYERRWASTLLDLVLAEMRQQFASDGKEGLFDNLKWCLSGEQPEHSYRLLADELGMSEGAVRVTVHRMRRRYAQLVRDRIAQTVASPEEVEQEIRELFAATRA